MIIFCKGEQIENPYCNGSCYCHSMEMIHGNDPNTCAECGCPKTLIGFEKFKKEKEKEKK